MACCSRAPTSPWYGLGVHPWTPCILGFTPRRPMGDPLHALATGDMLPGPCSLVCDGPWLLLSPYYNIYITRTIGSQSSLYTLRHTDWYAYRNILWFTTSLPLYVRNSEPISVLTSGMCHAVPLPPDASFAPASMMSLNCEVQSFFLSHAEPEPIAS